MARAALKWTRADLADASGVGVATVVRFESGANVTPDLVQAMRGALEAKRVRFHDTGKLAGAVQLMRAG